MPSTISINTTSPSDFSIILWAAVAPTFPEPTIVILLRAATITSQKILFLTSNVLLLTSYFLLLTCYPLPAASYLNNLPFHPSLFPGRYSLPPHPPVNLHHIFKFQVYTKHTLNLTGLISDRG